MGRISRLVALVILIGGGAGLAEVPKHNDAGRMGTFIPATAGPWTSEADQVFDAETIFQYIDGAGEVYRSYNMKLLVSRRFHKDGRPDLVVDLFDMGTSADAFGVFTHDLDGEDAGVGQGSTYKGGLLSFWKGRYFGSIFAEEETRDTKDVVLDLGRRIALAIHETGTKPAILSFLPAEGLAPELIRYFHNYSVLNHHFFVADKDILLLDQTAAAALGPYGAGDNRSYLFLAAYPDEKKAARAYASFSATYMPDASKPGMVRAENKKWTAAARVGNIVIVVFDAASDSFAMGQLAAVQSLIEKARSSSPADIGQR